MNICFILVLSVVLQLLFGFIMKLLFPYVVATGWIYYVELMLLSFVSIFLPAYLYLKDEKKKYFTDTFEGVKLDGLIFLSIGIGVCGQFVGIISNLPIRILLDFFGVEITRSVPEINSFSAFVLAVIALCVVPAIFEEIMFRGIVFNYFRQFGKKSAVIISSLLFAIMHFDFSNFFATFLIGLVCGIIICMTNRICYTMIIHFMMNFTSVFSAYLQKFEIANNFYIDIMPMLFLVSIPLLVYLVMVFKQKATYMPYHDQEEYETIVENIIPINEESSIKIIEHDIRENNMKMAFRKLYASPFFYILILFFIYLGGSDIWK